MSVGLEGVKRNVFDYLNELPPGALSFEELEDKYNLGTTSIEQINPITKMFSQTIQKNIPRGLRLLLDVEEKVTKALEEFIPTIMARAPLLAERMQVGGRVFLVGAESSGRVAIDIAAKCVRAFPAAKEQVRGVIAGGDCALVRGDEGFEDLEGGKALEGYGLCSKDTVILISANGSSSFNVGCGRYSVEQEARVAYFYNSLEIPSRTTELFKYDWNSVTPLRVDIGPQAIAGSTRLQGATLAEACLGALLVTALYLKEGKKNLANEYPQKLVSNMQAGIKLIRGSLEAIGRFAAKEKEVFSNPKDGIEQGYVTFVALEDSIRDVFIDFAEVSDTFSTIPIRPEGERGKRPEFQAYLLGEGTNRQAWESLLGRKIALEDVKRTELFLLACKAKGLSSFQNRPKGKGSFLICVAKLKQCQRVPQEMMDALREAKGHTGLILLCRGRLSAEQKTQLNAMTGCVLALEEVPYDAVGFSETIILKQVLNLISNGSMALMHRIYGNQLIDLRTSNGKHIDRCMRMIKTIWNENRPNFDLNDQDLYHYIVQVDAIKKKYEENGIYTPSVAKIVLAMIDLMKTPNQFDEIVTHLAEKGERTD